MTSIWVMFAIIILNGEPKVAYLPFEDQAQCEAAKSELVKEIIVKDGAFKGSITCFEAKIGDGI